MSKIINNTEIEQFKKDGAVLIKGKFDISWIEKLKKDTSKQSRCYNKFFLERFIER